MQHTFGHNLAFIADHVMAVDMLAEIGCGWIVFIFTKLHLLFCTKVFPESRMFLFLPKPEHSQAMKIPLPAGCLSSTATSRDEHLHDLISLCLV